MTSEHNRCEVSHGFRRHAEEGLHYYTRARWRAAQNELNSALDFRI